MLRKINLLLLLFFSLLTHAQKKGSISVKKAGAIDFFRIGDFKDSIVVKNESDMFYSDISSDSVEIKLHNATLLKTSDEKKFKLVYAPGMRYRMIYICDNADKLGTIANTYEAKIAPDGVVTGNKKEIVIELWNRRTDKIIVKHIFVYKNQ